MDEASALALLNQVSHETAEGQSPLRDFYGRLVRIDMFERQNTDDDGSVRNSFQLKYMFDQLRVIHSVSVWQYETADLSFYINKPGEAPQPTNRTGILFDSVAEILGKQSKPPDGYGKMFHIKWMEGHSMKRRTRAGEYEDYLGPAYRVVDIDGIVSPTPWVEPATDVQPGVQPTGVPVPQNAVAVASAPDLDTHLIALANGKNHPQTVAVWMGDARVTADATLFGQIVADNGAAVVNRLLSEGKMVSNDGFFAPALPPAMTGQAPV